MLYYKRFFAQYSWFLKLFCKDSCHRKIFESACRYFLYPVWKDSISHVDKTVLEHEIVTFSGKLIKTMTLCYHVLIVRETWANKNDSRKNLLNNFSEAGPWWAFSCTGPGNISQPQLNLCLFNFILWYSFLLLNLSIKSVFI